MSKVDIYNQTNLVINSLECLHEYIDRAVVEISAIIEACEEIKDIDISEHEEE